jgi:hypothetical protein
MIYNREMKTISFFCCLVLAILPKNIKFLSLYELNSYFIPPSTSTAEARERVKEDIAKVQHHICSIISFIMRRNKKETRTSIVSREI